MIPWHRLFGIALTDLLAGTAWEVVLEMDLSVKQQRLDIVVVRRGKGPQPKELPDGLGPLADHNLITYKSLREPLDGWALKELAAHSVNYRKQVSPSLDRLLPEESFRLFAICTRFLQKLAKQIVWQSKNYKPEGIVMPYTKQDFLREVTKEHLDLLTPDERIAGLSPAELRLTIHKAEERLARGLKEDKQRTKPRAKSKRSSKRDQH